MNKLFCLASMLLSFILGGLLFSGPVNSMDRHFAWPYADLQVLRTQRVVQLEDSLSRFEEKARAAASDKVIVSVLELSAFHAQALRQGATEDEFGAKIRELKENFRQYYIDN
jgi:hypothetical protein